MPLANVTLDDKYTRSGPRLPDGVQALVRLPLMQRERDRAAGLNTAGFISGYRGSPLGAYDNALWQARKHLEQHHILSAGVNEDLAATAIWGTQQVNLFPGAHVRRRVRHLVRQGPRRRPLRRRVQARQRRRHARSTAACSCSPATTTAASRRRCRTRASRCCQRAMMPVLNPADVQDYLDFGLLRLRDVALLGLLGRLQGDRRHGRKLGASVDVDPQRVEIVHADDFALPPGGLNIRWPDPPLEQERRLHGPKMHGGRTRSRARTASTASCSIRPARGSASSPPARPTSTCARRSTISASTTRGARDARHAPLQGRHDVAARAERRARFAAGSRKSSSSRRSARFIEDQLEQHALQLGPTRGRASSASATSTAACCCRPNGELHAGAMSRSAIAARLASCMGAHAATLRRAARACCAAYERVAGTPART